MTTYTATYSPDDNKLRLYASTRLDAELYARVKAAGFRWAPKQDLFVAPAWSPGREDLLIEIAGEIEDEDRSLVERAEDRAERFEGYSASRAADAESARKTVSAIADNIPFGQPILVGHHSEKRARRDVARIDAGMRRAVNNWKAAKYWEYRAESAVRHAKYKERPDVRARRIRKIESEKRKQEKRIADFNAEIKRWRSVLAVKEPDTQHKAALHVANQGGYRSMCFPLADYPRDPPASQYEGVMSLWSALDDGVINAVQAAEIALRGEHTYPARASRWVQHYDNRLKYERAMLAAEGGTVTDKTGPEVGGAVQCWQAHRGGWAYIQKVNKVSVSILMFWDYSKRPYRTTVPLDKIIAVMTKAEVGQASVDGRVVPNKFPQAGFHLIDAAPATLDAPDKAPSASGASDQPVVDDASFKNIEAVLKSGGAKAVAVPQLFVTPPDLAARMVDLADIQVGDRVLEPSAGTGALLNALHDFTSDLDVIAVEVHQGLATALDAKFGSSGSMPFMRGSEVWCENFYIFNTPMQFDKILMNPPFAQGVDIQHITLARAMLKPGGRLVAICANGPRQQKSLKPEAEFWEELPANTFKSAGTEVRAALVIFRGYGKAGGRLRRASPMPAAPRRPVPKTASQNTLY